MNLHVTAYEGKTTGTLSCGYLRLPCIVGKAGVAIKQAEGDNITPIGTYDLREIYYRADRVGKPVTGLPVVEITKEMGWCDDSESPEYNKLVTLPFEGSHETLWRDDHAYDYIIVVGYNDEPIEPGRGSAIFIHLQQLDGRPTAGCVALSEVDIMTVMRQINPGSKITIGNEPA